MIEKERLKEMIKNNEKIYIVSNLKLSEQGELCSTSNTYIQDYAGLDFATDLIKSISNFSECYFETKEQAEWNLKFGNITRTETLSLPSWEEIKKYGSFTFKGKDETKYTLYYISGLKTLSLVGYTTEDYAEATKENYIKACELAKKLFLGEEE